MKRPIWVIGLGLGNHQDLSATAREILERAQVLIGGRRLIAGFENHPADKIVIGSNLGEILARVAARDPGEEIVILASGDPGFHGIAGTLLKHFPPEEIRILPHISSLQASFAKAGIVWNDTVFTSAHAHSLAEIVGWAKRVPKLGILTDPANTPSTIAKTLLAAEIEDCRAIVGENLGAADERLVETQLSTLVGQEFAPLNVMLLIQAADWQPWPVFSPRRDDAYAHRCGLITKADLRALSLTRLNIRPTDTLWDIGAGSGAVSIEMAELAWQGTVFAVEKDPQNIEFTRKNRKSFNTLNLEVIAGEAPESLAGLPAPQGVFIGGSGGKLAEIMAHIHEHAAPGCRVVANFATLENLNLGYATMKPLGWKPQYSQINIAHSKAIAAMTRLEPLNPVFILEGTRP